MPLPPLLICASTLASLPFLSDLRLNRPFSGGPILVSSVVVLWQMAHCVSTISLPLAGSPFWAAPAVITVDIPSNVAKTMNRCMHPQAIANGLARASGSGLVLVAGGRRAAPGWLAG